MSNIPVLQSHVDRINLLVDKLRKAMHLPPTHEICIYCQDRYPVATQVHDHCPSWECRRQCGECAQERAEDFYDALGKEMARGNPALWDED
jgi:hypothetical protein